jgi:hypothetical protein
MGIKDQIDAFNRKVVKLSQEQVKAIGAEIHNQAVKMTPRDTGRLQNGWELDFAETTGGEVHAIIQNNVEYARYVEEGTDKKRPERMLARAIEHVSKVL